MSLSDRRLAYGLLILGIIAVLLALLWDSIGIGGDNTSFGPVQIVGLVAGIIAILIGLYLAYVRKPVV